MAAINRTSWPSIALGNREPSIELKAHYQKA
jgi:hypothetical protein